LKLSTFQLIIAVHHHDGLAALLYWHSLCSAYVGSSCTSTAPALGGTATCLCGSRGYVRTPSRRHRPGCAAFKSATSIRRQALVDPSEVHSNGVIDIETTTAVEDCCSNDGNLNQIRIGDHSDSNYCAQTIDWPLCHKDNIDQGHVNTGKSRRMESAGNTVNPLCIRAKHVPSILRRQKQQKPHHHRQQQQHCKQLQRKHNAVGISEHTLPDR